MRTVYDIIEDFQKFYGKQLNDTMRGFWLSQLSQLDEEDLCNGVVALKGREPTTWLPNLATVKKYYFEAREARLNLEKAKAPTYNDLERSARSDHGRQAIRLMLDMSKGLLTRAQYLAKMRDMHRMFPKYNWIEHADEIEEFWANEPKRHAKGRDYLERIWRLQDASSF